MGHFKKVGGGTGGTDVIRGTTSAGLVVIEGEVVGNRLKFVV